MQQDRLWRKNRARYNESISFSKNFNRICIGVDLNRNFDFQWGTGIDSLHLLYTVKIFVYPRIFCGAFSIF